MGAMCCCYVKNNDDYEALGQKSASGDSPNALAKYGTTDVTEPGKDGSDRAPETKHPPQKSGLQSTDSEQRITKHVRIHVSSSDSDESEEDLPIPKTAPKVDSEHSEIVAMPIQHTPVQTHPSITIEGDGNDESESSKTIALGLATVIKDIVQTVSPSVENIRAEGEGASAAESDAEPEAATTSQSSGSANVISTVDNLDGNDKMKKAKRKSVVKKVGTSVRRASRKASKSVQKGMAKMLHSNKGKDAPADPSEENASSPSQTKVEKQVQTSDDETDNQDESDLPSPAASPISPGYTSSPGPHSPRSPRPTSPGSHRPTSPGSHRPLSPGLHSPISPGRKSPTSPSRQRQLGRMSSDRMQSKYAREKMLEREKQWSKIESEAQDKQVASSAIGQALQAATERGEKLSEVKEASEMMKESSFNFAESARILKEKKRKQFSSH